MGFRPFVNALELNSHIRLIRIDFLNKGISKWHEHLNVTAFQTKKFRQVTMFDRTAVGA